MVLGDVTQHHIRATRDPGLSENGRLLSFTVHLMIGRVCCWSVAVILDSNRIFRGDNNP